MFHKIVTITLVITLMNYSAAQNYNALQQEPNYVPSSYYFYYDIRDENTGDVHGHKETRGDDKTEGEYYLIDADGFKRTVTYRVDSKSGFVAQVQRTPIKGYQQPMLPVVQPQQPQQPFNTLEAATSDLFGYHY
ncbi:larval cuticle protein A2B-like [Uranotaenia lowii]|uniref:larval cuticle protein A2B-like n=1 Tax=Uranotaenia lowii TaxID=190385 RepID=UPI002478B279|nr:larval cuticle protein A2B-like [Uranotaenia lowii]